MGAAPRPCGLERRAPLGCRVGPYDGRLMERRAIARERPQLWGDRGAASTSHPLATAAAQTTLATGGNAVDAAVAAQAVLAVVAPQACGVGGDAIALVHEPGGRVTSVHGAGRWSEAAGSL